MNRYYNSDPTQRIVENIRSVIIDPNYTIYLFGSRSWKSYKSNSDRDIMIKWPRQIPLTQWLALHRNLDELPYPVDIVDYHTSDLEFLRLIEPDLQLID